MNRIICPICKNPIASLKDRFWICNDCKFEFANPPDQNTAKRHYQTDIGLLAQNVLEQDHKSNKDTKLRKYCNFAIKYLTKNYQDPIKICDIGCGTGTFLKKLERLKYNVYGYDLNREQCSIARYQNRLLNISLAQSIEEYCSKKLIKENFFDIITAFEVIEHVLDVNVFLKNICTYLKPGGILILSTPNSKRFRINELWDYPPIHFLRFNYDNIKKLLEKYGFVIEYFRTYNELGYYSSNFLAKLKTSRFLVKKMVISSSKARQKGSGLRLFGLLARVKRFLCILIDIPFWLYLVSKKDRGHTIFIIVRKAVL